MRFPWVSRELYESACAERDRLRTQNDDLLNHRVRVDRAENGMSELPRDYRKPLDPPPKSIAEYIKKFAFKATRQAMWAEANKRRKAGQSWEEIEAQIKVRPSTPLPELEPNYEEDEYETPADQE